MILYKNKNIITIKSKLLNDISWISHGFSTKYKGVSFNSNFLNLGFNTNDTINNVVENRKLFADSLNICYKDFVCCSQEHGNNIKLVKNNDIGKGSINYYDSIKKTDGLLTNEKNIPLFTIHADCVPIFLVDIENKVIGLLHSGYKGTIKNIAGKSIKFMSKFYNTNPKKIKAYIGPSIDICCYNIDYNKIKKIKKILPKNNLLLYTNNNYISLKKINEFLLKTEGVEDIEISNFCTSCNNKLFFSYRYEKSKTGRMAATIMIK